MNTPVLPTPALRSGAETRAVDVSVPFADSRQRWRGRRGKPAVDGDGAGLVAVSSDGFDKLDEGAAGLWDAVLRPRCVVEVTDQGVVAVLLGWKCHFMDTNTANVMKRLQNRS